MAGERIEALDVVRGFAVLGILTMNITLGLPGAARLIPTIAGGFRGANFAVWVAGYLLFDEKMITLFSMLFGAGIVLFARGRAAFLRRQAVLLGIGLVHAYLIWEGDILVPYAICGLAVFPFREWAPRRLLVLAFLVWLPSLALSAVFAGILEESRGTAAWRAFQPGPAEVERMIAERRAESWSEGVRKRAPEALGVETTVFAASFSWTISARMLVGMALFKLGILAGTRTAGFYWRMAMAGYGVGYPFVVWAMGSLLARGFDPVFLFRTGLEVNQFGSLFVALGHAGVLLGLLASGRMAWLMGLLGHVGRLALTNYLGQSIVATGIFYGYGLGQFGRWDRVELLGLVVAMWVAQMAASHWWLRYFEMGPAERAWRRLSYGGQVGQMTRRTG